MSDGDTWFPYHVGTENPRVAARDLYCKNVDRPIEMTSPSTFNSDLTLNTDSGTASQYGRTIRGHITEKL
jgi:hypothetical protein